MNSITVTAPAKINLMLDVTGRRPDGYHELVTIMQSISLSDTVYLSLNDSCRITIECNTDGVPLDEENIAYRAAEAFYLYSQKGFTGLHIKIVKDIPLQAGLGGGSADCAAVLVGLNKLLGTNYYNDELCQIGVKLGADVPFCTVGGTKICRGIGEIMSYAPALEPCSIVIGKGGKGISTKKAYEKIDAAEMFSGDDITGKYDGTVASVKAVGRNIFEEVSDCKDVLTVKEILLQHGAEYAAMSGSGSAVFGLFGLSGQKNSAYICAERLRAEGFFSEVCIPLSYGAKYFDR